MKYESILETVGRTPIVRLCNLSPPGVSIYAKVESFNPMGSIKDRLALAVIERAEQTGALRPGQTVVEATSGNTGIGLAMVCARKGYPLVIVMAENFSIERRRLMRFLGAKVVLTPAALKGSGMLAKAMELAEANGWFLPRQFENEANADIHTATTAQEILADFENERLDYWVTAYGTGGTLKGVARALRAARPETRIALVEPSNSALVGSGVPQPKSSGSAPPESHPAFRPHPIQGTSPDFIPKLALDALEAGWIDETVPVDGADALRMSRELAAKEGIFVGISAGAALAGAIQVARKAPRGSTLLCMLPDTGERYLSTPLFDDVPVEMTAEELEIARSTYRPVCVAQPPAPAAGSDDADDEADAFVRQVVGEEPVVLFALEWCEFCWSVRRLFKALEIPYRAVDLDSADFLAGGWGGRVRSALGRQIGVPTIPQIFIGGQHLGGCMDVFTAAQSGALHQRLRQLNLNAKPLPAGEALDLLPKWLPKPVAAE